MGAINNAVVHYMADGELSSVTDDNLSVQKKDLYKVLIITMVTYSIRDANTNTINDLDTAGYARLDDVDFTAFTEQLTNLSSRISELGKGKKIWIGNDVTNTWNIRRIDENSTITDVQSNGNGYLVYTTDVTLTCKR